MDELIRRASFKLAQVGEALGIRNLDNESGMIFMTGGTGVVGHRVAKRLLDAGYPQLRLGAHHPEALEEMNRRGAEVVEFNWENAETYGKALKGVRSVLCTAAYTKEWHKHFPAFLWACKKAGVRHFVKLSFYHARVSGDSFQEVPLVKAHGDCDEMLIDMLTPKVESMLQGDVDVTVDYVTPRMSYTILQATHFMSNPFVFQGKELREKGSPSTFFGASHNHGVNYVSPNDVAEVAVRVLLEPRSHYNKEYTLTGPEAIPDQQVASLLSKHLKKPVMYVDQPLHEFQSEKQISGEPDWRVEDFAALEKVKASGKEEDVRFITDDVEKICGRKAETYDEYLAMIDMMTKVELGPTRSS